MADSDPAAKASTAPPNAAKPKPQNPALRMLGLPNFRFRLPSRNWLIFLTVTGSFAGALIYDRREKKRAQQKWCNLVAHIASEPLQTTETRRKLTVFLSAPPGDGLRPAREHFQEYVKPVLVSAAMDYEVVEGRREGDVRVALANRIRRERRRAGEGAQLPDEDDELESQIRSIRDNFGIHDEAGERGDMIIGRHTWKEYIRGLHEGWLGPVDAPPPPEPEQGKQQTSTETADGSQPTEQEQSQEKKESEPEKKQEPEKPKRPPPTPAYVLPSEYPSCQPSPSIPREFQASSPIAFPHLLGFLNTPIRIYRFLTERRLADSVGRDVAALVLASSSRPYHETQQSNSSESTDASPTPSSSSSSSSPTQTQTQTLHYEQQSILADEEKEWHKSVNRPAVDPAIKEREWLDSVAIDPRLGSRMRRFTLAPEEESRAERIGDGKEWIKGQEKPPHVPAWKQLLRKCGWDEEDPRANVVLGNIDGEDGE